MDEIRPSPNGMYLQTGISMSRDATIRTMSRDSLQTQSRDPTIRKMSRDPVNLKSSRELTILTKPSLSRSATIIIEKVAKASVVSSVDEEILESGEEECGREWTREDLTSPGGMVRCSGNMGPDQESLHEECRSPASDIKTETDLEIRSPSPVLLTEEEIYEQTCSRLRLIPMAVVTSSLSSQELHIKGRSLRTNDVLALCRALLDNMTIQVLRLDMNGITDQSVRYISLMLEENRNIHTLSLAENKIGAKGAIDITETLVHTKSLTSCNLSGNNFGDAEAYLFANMIKENQSLRELNLCHNEFGDQSCELLGAAVADNEHLHTLNMSWNRIRPTGSVHIYRGLAMNVCLHTLNLAMNGCSNDGSKMLGQALTVNQCLTELDISCNRIYDAGAAALAKALKVNENLQVLKLSQNPLSPAGVMGLLAATKANPESKLRLLDVSSVPIHQEALELTDAIRERAEGEFRFLYCRLLRSKRDGEEQSEKLDPRNPMILLKEYVSKRGLRLVDLFKLFYSDNSGSVSREEFISGLKKIEVPFSSGQLESLMDMLDKDGDGEVDYEELLIGDKQVRRKLAKLAEAKREKAKKS